MSKHLTREMVVIFLKWLVAGGFYFLLQEMGFIKISWVIPVTLFNFKKCGAKTVDDIFCGQRDGEGAKIQEPRRLSYMDASPIIRRGKEGKKCAVFVLNGVKCGALYCVTCPDGERENAGARTQHSPVFRKPRFCQSAEYCRLLKVQMYFASLHVITSQFYSCKTFSNIL